MVVLPTWFSMPKAPNKFDSQTVQELQKTGEIVIRIRYQRMLVTSTMLLSLVLISPSSEHCQRS